MELVYIGSYHDLEELVQASSSTDVEELMVELISGAQAPDPEEERFELLLREQRAR